MGWYDRKVRRVRDLSCGDRRIFLELEVRRLDCRKPIGSQVSQGSNH
jgi:zinc-finger of transposase IS204/IS1001/IS1096/IS1165